MKFELVKDNQGFAMAIAVDGFFLLHLQRGTVRNEENADKLLAVLNAAVSESDRALAMIRDATDHALDEAGLVESVAVLISQCNNARRYAETFRAKLKELGHEFI